MGISCNLIDSIQNPQLLEEFACVEEKEFVPTFKEINNAVIRGETSFEYAIEPYTKYSTRQFCNRLWRDAPELAKVKCPENSPQKLDVKFYVSDESKAALMEAFETAVRLRPDLDPRVETTWNIIPKSFSIILVDERKDYKGWSTPFVNAQTGSHITNEGDFHESVILDPAVFQYGKAYAAATIAHELVHAMLDLRGNSKALSRAIEEQIAYDVAIHVLQILLAEYEALPQTNETKNEIENIQWMILKEINERETWVASEKKQKEQTKR